MQWTIKLEARTGWGDTETCEIGTVSRGVTGKSAGDVGLLSWMKRRPFSPNCSVAWDRVASRIAGPSDGTALSIAQTVRIYFGRPNPSIWLRTRASMATSVASVSWVRDRNASPITRLYLLIAASTFARTL
jgi:hypothetical protein